ncbi:MAG TPA: hypothetical protein VJ579_03505 [Candidatus Paceibacterota bacterium]|nr:hypothetical protein [Candidatus Paceibacterota bacterium]
MSQRVVYICGNSGGGLAIALLTALIKAHSSEDIETLLVPLEEPLPLPVFELSAHHEGAADEQVLIPREDHTGCTLRTQRHNSVARWSTRNKLIRSRRAQSMTRRCKHRY